MPHIKLTQNQYTIVDDKDYEKAFKFKWCYNNGYAMRNESRKIGKKTILLHRFLMNPPSNMSVDHINGNRLDNRRQNLRICSHRENLYNQSGNKSKKSKSIYKGVFWDTGRNKWLAMIGFQGRSINLGRFVQERHAAMAYDIWAKELFGEYAKLNF